MHRTPGGVKDWPEREPFRVICLWGDIFTVVALAVASVGHPKPVGYLETRSLTGIMAKQSTNISISNHL